MAGTNGGQSDHDRSGCGREAEPCLLSTCRPAHLRSLTRILIPDPLASSTLNQGHGNDRRLCLPSWYPTPLEKPWGSVVTQEAGLGACVDALTGLLSLQTK